MRKQGFTLTELLIVIAIVAIIAAIIFPVFFAARERGRRAVCQSNLRQLAIAMQMYVHDNDGQFPLPNPLWYEAILPNVGNKQVFACPDNPQYYNDPNLRYDMGIVDYDYNFPRLVVFERNVIPHYPNKYRLMPSKGLSESTVSNQADLWLNADDEDFGWIDGTLHNSLRQFTAPCRRILYASTLHSGGGNYSFVDGHVKWLTPEQYGATECAAGPLPVPFKG